MDAEVENKKEFIIAAMRGEKSQWHAMQFLAEQCAYSHVKIDLLLGLIEQQGELIRKLDGSR